VYVSLRVFDLSFQTARTIVDPRRRETIQRNCLRMGRWRETGTRYKRDDTYICSLIPTDNGHGHLMHRSGGGAGIGLLKSRNILSRLKPSHQG
jgi:hypothetical protein